MRHDVPGFRVLVGRPAHRDDLAQVDVLDRISVGVELERSERRVRQLHRAHRGEKLARVGDVAVHAVERGADPLRGRVERRRHVRGQHAFGGAVAHDEAARRGVVAAFGVVPEADDPVDQLGTQRADVGLIGRRLVGDQRDLVLQSERAPLLEEVQVVGADHLDEHGVRMRRLDARDVRAVVGRAERRPHLRDDLAALLGEGLREPAGVLVAERVGVGDRRDGLVPLLRGPFAGDVRGLTRAPARDLDDERVRHPLREVVGGDGRHDQRDAMLLGVRRDGEPFVREVRTDDDLRAVLLDGVPRLIDGVRRVRAGVVHRRLQLVPGDALAVLRPVERPRVDHVVAGRGGRPRGRREERDLDRRGRRRARRRAVREGECGHRQRGDEGLRSELVHRCRSSGRGEGASVIRRGAACAPRRRCGACRARRRTRRGPC